MIGVTAEMGTSSVAVGPASLASAAIAESRDVKLFGLMMVRDEADIVRLNILHHLASGVDCLLVADNGSTDGTDRVLDELSRSLPVVWTRYPGPYYQWDITTQLAREAYLRGADWVVPIDADEFWWNASGNLKDPLADTPAEALQVEVLNFIQQRGRLENSPEALLDITRRTPEPVGPIDQMRRLVEAEEHAYVEMMHPAKWIARASSQLEIGLGNHTLSGITGPTVFTDRIVCLHAPLRSRGSLENLARAARRAAESGNRLAWHWFRWQRLAAEGELDREWAANSYDQDGLDVFGKTHAVVVDLRLRDAAARWLEAEAPSVAEPPGNSAPPLVLVEPDIKPEREPQHEDTADVSDDGEVPEIDVRRSCFAGLAPLLLSLLVENQQSVIMQVGATSEDWVLFLGQTIRRIDPGSTLTVIDLEGKAENSPPASDPASLGRDRRIEDAGIGRSVEILGYYRTFPYSFHPISFPSYWDRPIPLLLVESRDAYLQIEQEFTDFEFWIAKDGYLVFVDPKDDLSSAAAIGDQLVAANRYREVVHSVDLIVLQKLGRSGAARDQN